MADKCSDGQWPTWNRVRGVFPARRRPRRGGIGTLFLLMGWWIGTFGCAGLLPTYEGMPARPDNRRPVSAMQGQAAEWRSRDVVIHYQAVAAEDLHISGTVERLNTIKHFTGVNYFRITIHFMAGDGTIITSQRLWSAGAGMDSTLIRWTFTQRYPLPPGTAAIGFSYRGVFSESGGESGGRVEWEVWERP